MSNIELLDEQIKEEKLRKPIVKVLEPLLLLGYSAFVLVLLFLVYQEGFDIDNIFEEIIFCSISIVTIYYIVLWRKASIEKDLDQNRELLESPTLKYLGYLSFLTGFFLGVISIMVFVLIISPENKWFSFYDVASPILLLLLGSCQIYYSVITTKQLRKGKR